MYEKSSLAPILKSFKALMPKKFQYTKNKNFGKFSKFLDGIFCCCPKWAKMDFDKKNLMNGGHSVFPIFPKIDIEYY